ncbi:M1 family metallopeptidase [Arachidicoccus sp.]|uniref:M1 family metallopeptidase n=1 Tax=Arachidicoccus sp. TaxID=1872624 RepID=UPI003D2119D3
MKFLKIVSSLVIITFCNHISGQIVLPIPTNIQKAFDKGTRNTDGRPGKNYWQNTANYNINLNFIPETRQISGSENITYTNNSPDTLHEIWFKLYPNFYQKGAVRASSVKARDLTEGVKIESFIVNGISENAAKARINGTNMTVPIQPLLPQQQMSFTINWSYVLNKTSHQRTGEVEDGSYFVAYFFPRIAVYDDVDGWNKFPYNGLQEFYNDFCNFNVALSVPKNYVVWATGDLQNAREVFQSKYVSRIHKAEQEDGFTNIIDTKDLKEGNITADNATNVWKFSANHVTDFVFATSDHYVWRASSLVVDSSTGRRTRVDAAFDPKHKDFEEVASFARKTVQAMSYTFPAWPYPYPHETIYDGLDQMEYPMMVNDNPLRNRTASIELTDHEIFHTMFPFYMGTNETKYAFMDEGWATIGEWVISPMIDSTIVDDYGMKSYDMAAGSELDSPIITLSTQETGADYYLNAYPKPAIGYYYIRDMLGDKLFTKALHHYITTWQGKHPIPYDFFNCMNEGSGKNLNWFWKKWFFDNGYPDLGIENITRKGNRYQIIIESKGNKPTPVDITCTFSDGSTQTMHRSIEVWEKGHKSISLNFNSNKRLINAKLGSTYDADNNRRNDIFRMK